MIGIGDKVVCVEDDMTTDWMLAVESELKNFTMPTVGHVYTVRDIIKGLPTKTATDFAVGVQLMEISAGIDKYGDEWWYDINSFRKAVDAPEEQILMAADV